MSEQTFDDKSYQYLTFNELDKQSARHILNILYKGYKNADISNLSVPIEGSKD